MEHLMRRYSNDHLLSETVWFFHSNRYFVEDLEQVVAPEHHEHMLELSRSMAFRKFQLVEAVYELFDELRVKLGESPLAYNMEHIDSLCKQMRPEGAPEIEGIRCMMCLLDLNDWAWAQVRHEYIK
jgi:hypothetical protein